MGCTSSSATRAFEKQGRKDTSTSSIQIGNRSETECEPTISRREYNSWKHEVDLTDLQSIENGMALPVNQWVHKAMSEELSKSLSGYLVEPGKLAETIQERRVKLEEIAAQSETLTAATLTDLTKSRNLEGSKSPDYLRAEMDNSKSSVVTFDLGRDEKEITSLPSGQNLIIGL
ncbi:unnamed protein product [Cladocopium goreaui]|uniref:Protein kinase domain-containing protein n=1 Tax=Cladocopium goreaui TaxID=2562237 RepID=A0A9P1M1Y5_9DINO|nr:unnamed protein product [Cladocopium goreaui]